MISSGGRISRMCGLSVFRKVGSVKQFRDGIGRAVTVDGREIAVFRKGDRFHAMDDKCPHMGASLSMGRLVGDKIECAWHEWRFDLETGCNAYKEWACVAIHEVRIEGDDVLVKLAEPRETKKDETPGDDDAWFKWDPEAGKKIEE
jgi:nitrite reductase/ring-hydroxylating ferredoxin subunit